MSDDPVTRLADLIAGQLRFVYVLGLARSGSTIVCRMLGAALDGAVYEPATPARLDRGRHYAGTILRAYDEARGQIGSDRPVALAIKDLSLFIDDRSFVATLAKAAHVVVTVREPAAQQASLKALLAHEFSPWQRIEIIFRYPYEALGMAWYFLVYGRDFVREASSRFGFGLLKIHRLAMAGWNLLSWRNLEAQLAALGDVPVSVLDADAMRLRPADTEAELRRIASSIAPADAQAQVEIAGHCRMLQHSKWAAEALSSTGIKAADGERRKPPPPDAFDAKLLSLTEAAYRRVLGARRGVTNQAVPASRIPRMTKS
jgi:hypothetical protein